jgi:NAD(P)-dependent dehydrogenase (short-subunit alcohol dehydrogenase family)
MSTRTAHLDRAGKSSRSPGAGSGLATANAFAQRVALVAIGDLDAAGARVAAEGIGRGATGLALDVTDRVSFESFLDEVEHRLGPLDGGHATVVVRALQRRKRSCRQLP